MVFTERYCVEAGIERCVEAVEKARRRSAIAVIAGLHRELEKLAPRRKLVDTLRRRCIPLARRCRASVGAPASSPAPRSVRSASRSN
jgi:hypothetical protein